MTIITIIVFDIFLQFVIKTFKTEVIMKHLMQLIVENFCLFSIQCLIRNGVFISINIFHLTLYSGNMGFVGKN